ncbi:DNA internalization-related competence protein ComEC/Rec2 [Alkalilimnicola sp. S0819]|uniref:DNA internalization-related competence protein ComEC/Rec2 n=1 Tax=Alkalilimnicola sp. S0819 TaxID=2613922 RepID=UPI0012625E80|nr:DNA internalization-related competence protein ComEC/Rec2 [Alkalilimnicola sp. S0819]KAB7627631.1 DNA internalization-related competence protein ComEC/Rec2 [Alkalilimnicola sp. S0819]MPQ15796.1 DNA internalization-related competence protein ComEC/Rec2 [Alkalilimnicola sp. S0819]
MRLASAALMFTLGAVSLHQLPALPPGEMLFLLPLLGLLLLQRPGTARRVAGLTVLFIGLGAGWAGWQAQAALDRRLPAALEGEDLWVEGLIADIPRERGIRTGFLLRTQSLQGVPGDRLPEYLRLSWYRDAPTLRAGQRWRLKVRLKRPHGRLNPGGFDYERWLFSRGVGATGYVRDSVDARQLSEAAGLAALRQKLYQRLLGLASNQPTRGMLAALAVGERAAMEQDQRDLLEQSGTAHLLAISGLHIGLVFGFGGFLARRLWHCSARLCQACPAPLAGALGGLACAGAYAALAGFTLPTQRALLMLTVAVILMTGRRRLPPADVLGVAVVAVQLWDPLALLGAGFWLSFTAVAAIALLALDEAGFRWRRLLRLQCLLGVALFPVLAQWFGQLPLVSPLANLLAIPWVGFLVVPLDLLAVLALPFSAELAARLLAVAGSLLNGLLQLLDWLLWLPAAAVPELPWWLLALSLAGAGLLLLPGGTPGRWLAVPLLASLLLYRAPRPQPGEAWVHILDVGQGLAVAVETRQHILLFDTGARLGPGWNMAQTVILPWLRARGWRALDALVISHADNDHSGGAATLGDALPIARAWVGEPLRGLEAEPCRQGQRWEWDGIEFAFLYPRTGGLVGNNASCVLRVGSAGAALLLPGDLEREGERALLGQGEELGADLLIAAHHGSRSSSTAAFIAAVGPTQVVYSAGYRNRYGFPHPEVAQRYRERGVVAHHSWLSGALSFRLGREGLSTASAERERRRRYYHLGK